MDHQSVIKKTEGLTDYKVADHQPQNIVIRILAKVISYIFHPLFVPIYIGWFLIRVQPYLFSGFTPFKKITTLIQFFLMYSFFPLVTVLLCKALGFLDSIYLRTQRDRVIPYITSMIFYFWMCFVFRNQLDYPDEVVYLAIAIFIASIAGLMSNIYMKVSMHAISMGILVTFIAILAVLQGGNATIYMSIAVFIAGLVCTARLIVSDHTPREIYIGLLIGICSQLLAVWVNGILP